MNTIYNKVNRSQMHSLVTLAIESLADIGNGDPSREEFYEAVGMLCEDVAGLELLSDDEISELCKELFTIYLNS